MANLVTIILTLLAVVAAYLCFKNVTRQDQRILAVLDGLKSVELQTPLEGTPKIATGFEANVDYFVDSLELLEAMELEPPEEAKPHDIVKTEKEFLETFAFFFKHSAASS